MILCEATYCKYNKDGHCRLACIKVDGDHECEDFEYVSNAKGEEFYGF